MPMGVIFNFRQGETPEGAWLPAALDFFNWVCPRSDD